MFDLVIRDMHPEDFWRNTNLLCFTAYALKKNKQTKKTHSYHIDAQGSNTPTQTPALTCSEIISCFFLY